MIFGRNEISAAGDEQLTWPDINWSHEKNGTFFILFLCYGEAKQKQTHAQKILFIILSFYSGLVERFPEIRQLQ